MQLRSRVVVTGVAALVAAGCAGESHGGAPPRNEPADWYAGTGMLGPLTFDAQSSVAAVTLESSIQLTASRRVRAYEILGVTVIAEIPTIGTDGKIAATLAHEGQEPGMYGTGNSTGPYTHGNAELTLTDPLDSCYTPPCSATERYTLTFEAIQLPASGSVELVWHGTLHVLLADMDGDDVYPPLEDEGEALSLAVVPTVLD